MDQCPVEILFAIFSFACTDGGATGLSLSLVSKRIRIVSRTHAFQTIALYGTRQISAFADLMEALEPSARRVKHLFLIDRRRNCLECPSSQDLEAWLRTRVLQDSQLSAPVREWPASNLLRLLRALAPSLRDLALLLFRRYDAHPLSVPLPALAELTIHSSSLHTAHAMHGLGLAPPHAIAELPALRRLHVVQDGPMRQPVPRAVARLAPRLTHLRFSRVVPTRMPLDDIARGLERLLSADDFAAGAGGFPPTLRRVIVQLEQPCGVGFVSVHTGVGSANMRC